MFFYFYLKHIFLFIISLFLDFLNVFKIVVAVDPSI